MLRENSTTEFKRELTDDIKRTVIAFANTQDGEIYIGVADNGEVVGVTDIDGTMLRISNMLRDSIKPDVTMFVSYDVLEEDDRQLICVSVRKGTNRPYYLAVKGLRPEGVYVRQGASSAPATQTAIVSMIKETDGDKYESLRSTNQELTFKAASEEFTDKNISFGVNQKKSLKLMTADGVYTNLGLLLSDQCQHTIKLAVFQGKSKAIFRDRREFEGSLFKQLSEASDFIDRYNRIHAEISGLYREDTRDYPPKAVREALLNCLVHREYAMSGSILISIYDDRIEFLSIGGLVTGLSYNDIMIGVSSCRNENLANVFYRLKLIEAYGTGIPTMLREYANYPQKPEIVISDNAFRITLPNANYIRDMVKHSPEEEAVLALFKKKQSLTRHEVETALSISQSKALRLLRDMVNLGLLKAVGGSKNRQYTLMESVER